MIQNEDSDSAQQHHCDNIKRISWAWLGWVIYGIVVLAVLGIASCFTVGAERARFWVDGLLAAALLSVVIVQAIIYKQQWHVMDRSLIIGTRAYVVAKIREPGKSEGPFQLRLRIQNGGNTPANNTIVRYSYGLREELPPHTTTPDDVPVLQTRFSEIERLGLVAPNDSYHVICTPPINHPPDDQWQSGQLKFYCWGRIDYEDIFKCPHHSEFCFVQSNHHPDGYPCCDGNAAY